MSKVIRAMKKVYWKGRKKIKKLPPVKAAKKYMGRKRKDKLLYETLPAAYNAHKNEPVDERKVIFIELRLPDVSNSFRILYDELQRDFDLDIHVHLLRNSFVPREEYIRRCKEMLADAATAKYIFVNEASDVLSCVDMRPETIVTQLWHACGSLQKVWYEHCGADLRTECRRAETPSEQQELYLCYRIQSGDPCGHMRKPWI